MIFDLSKEIGLLADNVLCMNISHKDYFDNGEMFRNLINDIYRKSDSPVVSFGFGLEVLIPYYEMGNINTKHLFGIDELLILCYYICMRGKYRRVLDLGANIGLHSIVMSKLGFIVDCYEPDPVTFKRLKNNLALNNCKNVQANQKAAGDANGTSEFIRVCGNHTGSHISGSKPSPYGLLEKFNVEVVDIGEIAHNYDFIKIDIEGYEAKVIRSIPFAVARKIDFMLEINGQESAELIWDFAAKSGLNIFLQKNGWKIAAESEELPLSYREGSVFMSTKDTMDWGLDS